MVFAIEPMINAGGSDVVMHDDQWSISTADGSLSAHFEHTVAVTDDGPRILTAAEEAAEGGSPSVPGPRPRRILPSYRA
jgi:methionyl aminopeptidase